MARESLQSALEQIYAQGGTDADARAYAASKGYELRPQEPLGPGHEAPAPWLGAERPGTGQAPLLDPSLTGPASMAGGMAGGAVAAPLAVASGPFAPVVEVAGVAMGAEAGRQTARAINYFAQGLTDRRPAVDRWLESLGNMAWDATLQAGGAAAGKAVRAGWGSVLKMLRPGDLGGVERLAAFERLGVKPNAGAVSQRPAVQGTELALAKLPTSGAITGKGLQATQDDLALAAGEIADRISAQARTVQEGGDILQRGIKGKGGFLDRFFGETETSFAAVNKGLRARAVPEPMITVGGKLEPMAPGAAVDGLDRIRVPMDKARAAIAREAEVFAQDPDVQRMMIPPQFQTILDKIQRGAGSLTWREADAFRKYVGRQAADPRLVSDVTTGQWKQLYRGIVEDMSPVAAQHGQGQQWRAALDAYRAGSQTIDDFLEQITSKPEVGAAFQAAFRGAKYGDKMLEAVQGSLTPEEWRALVGVQFREMGLRRSQDVGETAVALSGELRQWSPRTFLTSFKNLTPEARKRMFSGLPDGLQQAIQDLVTTSDAVAKSKAFLNTSNTGQANVYMALLQGSVIGAGGAGAVLGAPVTGGATLLAAAGLPPAFALLFERPWFVRWLAKGVQIAPANYGGLAAHLARLGQGIEGEKDPMVRELASRFGQGIANTFQQQAAEDRRRALNAPTSNL